MRQALVSERGVRTAAGELQIVGAAVNPPCAKGAHGGEAEAAFLVETHGKTRPHARNLGTAARSAATQILEEL